MAHSVSPISGLGSALYGWAAGYLYNPRTADFNSSKPFLAAAVLGLVGCTALFIFDRFHPIRQSLPEGTATVEANATREEGSVAEA